MRRTAWVWVLMVVGLSGCGSRPAPVHPEASGRDGLTPETAWHACFDTRSDYRRVAEYRCGDGSMPLRGDVRAGGAARSGNIGEGPDGHVLDRYEVPCPEGTVVLFVDMYHCDEESGPLSEAEIAQAMADLEVYLQAPEQSSPAVVNRANRAMTQLGITLPICEQLFAYLLPPEEQLPEWRALANIYTGAVLSDLYAHRDAFAPGADPGARRAAEDNGSLRGSQVMVAQYRRLVAAGYTALQHPQLERLAAIPPEQLVGEVVSRLVACRAEAAMPGMSVTVQD